MTFRQI